MLNRKMGLKVVQVAPAPRNITANLEYIRRVLESSKTDIIVFPELFLSGYETADLHDISLAISDAEIQALSRSCHKTQTALLVGFIESSPDGYYNSFLAIDTDGTIRPPIRKTHLFGVERTAFLEGDAIQPVRLCGVIVGVMNCFELEFPEVARTLRLKGAQVFLAGSANMHPYSDEHDIATRARVHENRIPLAYANRVGHQSGHDFCGGSRIIDLSGKVTNQLASTGDAHTSASIDLRKAVDETIDMLSQRRPHLYL